MVDQGATPLEASAAFGIKRNTLDKWIQATRRPVEEIPVIHDAKDCTVAEIRHVCALLDENLSPHEIAEATGYSRQMIRRCRRNPFFREATLEFDPRFLYSHTDLLDRAVVAQHLCADSTVGERLDLLFAVVGDKSIIEAPERRGYGRSIERNT